MTDPDTQPSGREAADEVFDGDPPDCDSCGEALGTNGECLQCLYSYETHLEQLGYDTPAPVR